MEHSLRIFQVDLNHVSRNNGKGQPFSFTYAPGVIRLDDLSNKRHSDIVRPAQIKNFLSLPQVVNHFGLMKEGRHVLGMDIYSIGTRTAHRTRVQLLGPSEEVRGFREFPVRHQSRCYVGPVDMDFGVAPAGKTCMWAVHNLSRRSNPVAFPIAETDIVATTKGDILSRPGFKTLNLGNQRVLGLH